MKIFPSVAILVFGFTITANAAIIQIDPKVAFGNDVSDTLSAELEPRHTAGATSTLDWTVADDQQKVAVGETDNTRWARTEFDFRGNGFYEGVNGSANYLTSDGNLVVSGSSNNFVFTSTTGGAVAWTSGDAGTATGTATNGLIADDGVGTEEIIWSLFTNDDNAISDGTNTVAVDSWFAVGVLWKDNGITGVVDSGDVVQVKYALSATDFTEIDTALELDTIVGNVIPEPSSVLLLFAGLSALALLRRRRS